MVYNKINTTSLSSLQKAFNRNVLATYLLENAEHTNFPKLLNTQSNILKNTLLHQAVEKNRLNDVEILIQYGASQNFRSVESGITPLHIAAILDNKAIIKKLLTTKHNRNFFPSYINLTEKEKALFDECSGDDVNCECGYKALFIKSQRGRYPKDEVFGKTDARKILIEKEILYLIKKKRPLTELSKLICSVQINIDVSESFIKDLVTYALENNFVELIALVLPMAINLHLRNFTNDTCSSDVCAPLMKNTNSANVAKPKTILSVINEMRITSTNKEAFYFVETFFEVLKLTYASQFEEIESREEELKHSKEEYLNYIEKKETISLLLFSINYCSKINNNEISTLMRKAGPDKWSRINLLSLDDFLDLINENNTLDASYNCITAFPCIRNGINLESLHEINISYNNLLKVEKEVFELKNLKKLDISHNEICSLPNNIHFTFSLRELNLADNNLKDLPKSFAQSWIVKLFLARNKFEDFPVFVCYMRFLKYLDISGNKNLIRFPSTFRRMRLDLLLKINDMDQMFYNTRLLDNVKKQVEIFDIQTNTSDQQSWNFVEVQSRNEIVLHHRHMFYQAKRNRTINLAVIGNNNDVIIIQGLVDENKKFLQSRYGRKFDIKVNYFVEEKITNQFLYSERSLYIFIWNITNENGLDELFDRLYCLAMYVPRPTVTIIAFSNGIQLTQDQMKAKARSCKNAFEERLQVSESQFRYFTFGSKGTNLNENSEDNNSNSNEPRQERQESNASTSTETNLAHSKKSQSKNGFGCKVFGNWFKLVNNEYNRKEKKFLSEFIIDVAASMKNADDGENVLGEKLPEWYFALLDQLNPEKGMISHDRLREIVEHEFKMTGSKCCKSFEDDDVSLLSDKQEVAEAIKYLLDSGALVCFKGDYENENIYWRHIEGFKAFVKELSGRIDDLALRDIVTKDTIRESLKDHEIFHGMPVKQILELFNFGFYTWNRHIQLVCKLLPLDNSETNFQTIDWDEGDEVHYCRFYSTNYLPLNFWVKLMPQIFYCIDKVLNCTNDVTYNEETTDVVTINKAVFDYVTHWKTGIVYNNADKKLFLEVCEIRKDRRLVKYLECDQLKDRKSLVCTVLAEDKILGARLISMISDEITLVLNGCYRRTVYNLTQDDELVHQYVPCETCYSNLDIIVKSLCLFSVKDCFEAYVQNSNITCTTNCDKKTYKIGEDYPELLFAGYPDLFLHKCHELTITSDEVKQNSNGVGFPGKLACHSGCFHTGKEVDVRVIQLKKSSEDFFKNFQFFKKTVLSLNSVSVHPNIVSLLGIRFDPQLSMILEAIPQKTLQDMKLFSRQSLYSISHQISRALTFLHKFGIKHCNLNPENIFIFSEDKPLVKIFSGSSSYLSPTSFLSGSLSYIAPEILINRGTFTKKSDIWSFAAVIHHMMTMNNVETDLRTIYSLLKEEVDFLKFQSRPNYLLCMKNLVEVCSSKKPRKRPTASELTSILSKPAFQFLMDVFQLKHKPTKERLLTSQASMIFFVIEKDVFVVDTGSKTTSQLPLNSLHLTDMYEIKAIYSVHNNLLAIAACHKEIKDDSFIDFFKLTPTAGLSDSANEANCLLEHCDTRFPSESKDGCQLMSAVGDVLIKIFPKKILFYCLSESFESIMIESIAIENHAEVIDVLHDKHLVLIVKNSEFVPIVCTVSPTGQVASVLKRDAVTISTNENENKHVTSLAAPNGFSNYWIGTNDGHLLVYNEYKLIMKFQPYLSPVRHLVVHEDRHCRDASYVFSYGEKLNLKIFSTEQSQNIFQLSRNFLSPPFFSNATDDTQAADDDSSDLLLCWYSPISPEEYSTFPGLRFEELDSAKLDSWTRDPILDDLNNCS